MMWIMRSSKNNTNCDLWQIFLRFLVKKEYYLKAFRNLVGDQSRKTLKPGKFTNIDERLKRFISQCWNVGVAINDQLLKSKALSEAAFHLNKLRTYSLQRNNREFSQSVLHLVNELENKIFRKPKDYKQSCIDY